MVRQLTFSLLFFMAVIACADDYIFATGKDGTEIVYTADRMIYTNWLDDCVLWMPFPSDVGGGSYPDYSIRSNHGTQTVVGARPTWSSGSYVFDSTKTNHIDCGDVADFDKQYTAFSAMIWARLTTTNHPIYYIFGKMAADPNRGWMFYITDATTTNKFAVYFHDAPTGGNLMNLISSQQVFINTWIHLALTFSANSFVNLYANGVQVFQETNSVINYLNGSNSITLKIGDRGDLLRTDNIMDGSMDDARIFDTALTSNQIYRIWLDTKDTHP